MTVELGFAALLGNCLKITMEGTVLLVSTGVPGIPSLTHLCWALEDRTEKQANCDAEEKSKADADFNVEDNPRESHVGVKEAYSAYLKTKGAS